MRKIIVPSIVCILLLTAVSCERSPKEEGKEEEELIIVSSTVFSLDGTDCRWSTGNEWINEELIIINSNEKLEKFIWCWNDALPPAIDFSKYTLLLAHGVAGNRVSMSLLDAVLFQTETGKYTLKVKIPLGLSGIGRWALGILTPKLSDDANITLEVRYILFT